MADERKHLDFFRPARKSSVPVTLRDHKRLHASREILRQGVSGSTSASMDRSQTYLLDKGSSCRRALSGGVKKLAGHVSRTARFCSFG